VSSFVELHGVLQTLQGPLLLLEQGMHRSELDTVVELYRLVALQVQTMMQQDYLWSP